MGMLGIVCGGMLIQVALDASDMIEIDGTWQQAAAGG
jgi:hypothetical protein